VGGRKKMCALTMALRWLFDESDGVGLRLIFGGI
jgi:hypothetical protein